VISPSADVIISPQINTKVNPFLNLEGASGILFGQVEGRVGYTYERDFTSRAGSDASDLTHRSFILARGEFNFTPEWRWGFSAERTSDDLLFDKYDIDSVYQNRGLYEPTTADCCLSCTPCGNTARSYVSVAPCRFKGCGSTKMTGHFPSCAAGEARYEPEGPFLGGRLRALGSVACWSARQGRRPRPSGRRRGGQPPRHCAQVDGVGASPSRAGCGSNLSPTPRPTPTASRHPRPAIGQQASAATPPLGVDLSMPFYRPLGTGGSIVLEPMAQLVASNESDRDPLIPNEDSVSFEFDETNLFEANKFPGFDRFEGGLRLNAGFRATYDMAGGRGGSLLVGRSFRAEEDTVFAERVGLRDKASDWIVAAQINPGYGLSFFNRSRLDADSLELQRSETRVSYANPRAYFAASNLRDVLDNTGRARNELDLFADVKVLRRFGVLAFGNADLEEDVFRRRAFGAYYADECLRFEVTYEREENDPRLGPSNNFNVRLILATLGDTAERGSEER
jgi:LPS-assembly protein